MQLNWVSSTGAHDVPQIKRRTQTLLLYTLAINFISNITIIQYHLACVDSTGTCWATNNAVCNISVNNYFSYTTNKTAAYDGTPCIPWSTYNAACSGTDPTYASINGSYCRTISETQPWCWTSTTPCTPTQNTNWKYCYQDESACGKCSNCKSIAFFLYSIV